MGESNAAHLTRLLHEWRDGSRDALDQLMPLVYEELRTLAARQLRNEWRHDRLQTTVVVNEAYLERFGQRDHRLAEPRALLRAGRPAPALRQL